MVSLFIAMSLDGYIAAPDGDIDFLSQVEQAGEDYGYGGFFNSVSAVVIGRKTYEKVLSFGEPFPYQEKRCIVLTSKTDLVDDRVEFFNGDLNALIVELKSAEQGNIYIDGGAEAIHSAMLHGLVDQYIVSVIPTLLGSGISLFKEGFQPVRLKLIRSTTYPSGLVQLCYRPA
jgi:dihydrofolate reductase